VLTRRGWALVAGSVTLVVAGRALGVLELFVLAGGGIGLAVLAVGSVLMRSRTTLQGTRRLVPARVHAGADSRVELSVRNRGDRPSPVVTLRDAVVQVRAGGRGQNGTNGGRDATGAGPARQARFHVAPLKPGQDDRAAYRLGAERRGLFRIGPLESVVADPFGLASRTSVVAPATELTVYPRVESVAPPPLTTGHDPRAGGGHPTALGSGDEFYGLRAYEQGDDLRLVHWPSTARQDELMIRQQELPWQGRATVLLDVRASVHDEASFEQAVSAAASLLTASWERDGQIRLLTTDGLDSGFGSGPGHLQAVMEHLAVIEPGSDRLDSLLGAIRRRPTGALVVVTATGTGPARRAKGGLGGGLDRLVAAPGGFGWVATVLIGAEPGGGLGVSAAGMVVHVGPGQSFAEAWNRAVAVAGARA
jgi:uncharacterized protein (DUF58 family)